MKRRWLWFLLASLTVASIGVGVQRSLDVGAKGSSARPTLPASGTPTPTPPKPSPKPHPVSLPALMEKRYDGRNLRPGPVLARTDTYTRYHVTYESGTLTISGVMNVPRGKGPFPVLVLSHGYIDPRVYRNGQGLSREQDYLARHGYVVLHTDYRNHAQSDIDPRSDMKLWLAYVEDVLNAVVAVKGSSLPYIDGEHVGLLGRSMGGGVALGAAVVRPDLVDGVVVFAPVSSNAVDNFNKWIRGPGERNALEQRIIKAYGSPSSDPKFWRNVSPVNFFDRIEVPVIIHHGTADDTCPIAWTRKTVTALERAGKEVRFFTYEGEHHAFGPHWPLSMQRTVRFLDARLKAG